MAWDLGQEQVPRTALRLRDGMSTNKKIHNKLAYIKRLTVLLGKCLLLLIFKPEQVHSLSTNTEFLMAPFEGDRETLLLIRS